MHDLLREIKPDLIVLARYMRILPEYICAEFSGRLINIHHSFLPSFLGANAYARAYEWGVKLIGATCHYATAELDAGPIIDQEVIRVSTSTHLRISCDSAATVSGSHLHGVFDGIWPIAYWSMAIEPSCSETSCDTISCDKHRPGNASRNARHRATIAPCLVRGTELVSDDFPVFHWRHDTGFQLACARHQQDTKKC